MKIVAISGSLRAGSSNAALLRAAAEFAPIEIWDGLGGLPHFNPDLDIDDPPEPVAAFRQRLRAADAVIICSPEYAHDVPGSLKNAFDWLVSDSTLVGKPVMIITSAPTYGEFAHAQLMETLTTMNWNVLRDASLLVRKNEDVREKLRQNLEKLVRSGSG